MPAFSFRILLFITALLLATQAQDIVESLLRGSSAPLRAGTAGTPAVYNETLGYQTAYYEKIVFCDA